MRPAWKYSLIPVIAGASTLFAVLPHRGADGTVRIVTRGDSFAYEPAEAAIEPGQRVAFVNETKQTHAITCEGCPWSAGDLQPAQTRFVTYPREARASYVCAYHPEGERGSVVVGSPPPAPPPTASPSPGELPPGQLPPGQLPPGTTP